MPIFFVEERLLALLADLCELLRLLLWLAERFDRRLVDDFFDLLPPPRFDDDLALLIFDFDRRPLERLLPRLENFECFEDLCDPFEEPPPFL